MKKQLAVLLSAGILLSSVGMSMTPVYEPLVVNAAYESEEDQMLSLINELRQQNGLTPFQTTPLMQEAAETVDTAMAAVLKLSPDAVEAICRDFPGMYPVNYNCPGQLSVSGRADQMPAFGAAVKAAG